MVHKFRAYDKVDKEWLFDYGNLGGFSLIGEVTLMGQLNTIPIDKWKDIHIMQSTGLRDKNGVEIYEGDIDDNGYVVSWCNNRQGWAMCVFEDSTFKNKAICHCYNCEGNFDIYEVSINIVSNIHES